MAALRLYTAGTRSGCQGQESYAELLLLLVLLLLIL